MNLQSFMERGHITAGYARTASNGAATGDRVSLENYRKCGILVKQEQAAGDAATLTVNMYTAASGGSSSTGITINNFWYMADVTAGSTADTWTKGTAAASITTSATASGVSYYWIEIDAEDLFSSGTSYPFIAVYHAGDGSVSNYTTADYFLFDPRYAEDLTPTAQS